MAQQFQPSLNNRTRANAYLEMAARKATIPAWLDASTPTRRIIRDYWRGELGANSPALERLRAICEARGYSYDLTLEALS